jgi:hypothetical protein
VRDRQEGTTERVNLGSCGAQANGHTIGPPSISDDGHYVAFPSRASNLVADDTNGFQDVFVHERVIGSEPQSSDCIAPSAPVITSPADNSFDTDGTITISGTAEPNSTVEVFEATASGDTSKGTTPVDASGNWTKTLSGVLGGSHAYKAEAKNAAGKTSGFSNTRTVIVDKVKPQVSSTTPLAGATGVRRNANLTATFSEEMTRSTLNSSTFKLFRVNSDGSTAPISSWSVSSTTDGLKATLNPFGATSTTLLAANAKYKAVVTTGAKDLAGNQLDQNRTLAGNQQKTWTFKTDST